MRFKFCRHSICQWWKGNVWFGAYMVPGGFPGSSDGKESACNAGDLGLIPESWRSPGGGHVNPLQYSSLENPHGQRSLVGYSPWGHKESDMTERLSTQHMVPGNHHRLKRGPSWQAGLQHRAETQLLPEGMWMPLTSFLICNLFTWRLRAEVKITKYAMFPDIQGECYFFKKSGSRTFLVVHLLRIYLLIQQTQVQCLVWELRYHRGATKPLHHNQWSHTLESVSPYMLFKRSLCNERSRCTTARE